MYLMELTGGLIWLVVLIALVGMAVRRMKY